MEEYLRTLADIRRDGGCHEDSIKLIAAADEIQKLTDALLSISDCTPTNPKETDLRFAARLQRIAYEATK